MTRYGSRKFMIALLVLALATTLRVIDMIDAQQWVTLAGSIVGLYSLANVGQKAVTKTTTS